MSFLSPSTSVPSSTSTARRNTYSEAEAVPWFRGYQKIAPKWVSDRFNDHWTNGSYTGQAYCSVVGVLSKGTVHKVRGFYVSDDRYHIIDFVRPTDPTDPDYYYIDFYFGRDAALDPGAAVAAKLGLNQAKEGATWAGRLYWGTDDQPIDDDLTSLYGDEHPPYRGQTYVIMARVHCGQVQANSQAKPAIPNISFGLIALPSEALPTALRIPSTIDGTEFRGVNPVSAIADALTHPGAMGLPMSMIDLDWFTAKAVALNTGTQTAGGLMGVDARISPICTGSTTCEAFITDMLKYIDGWLYMHNGKLRIDWSPCDGTMPADSEITEISQHHMVEPAKIERGTLADAPSKITVSGYEGDSGDLDLADAVETCAVPFVRSLTGDVKVESVERPFVTSRAILQRMATIYAGQRTIPKMEGTLKLRLDAAVNPDGTSFRPGNLFKLSLASSSIYEYCRVTEVLHDEAAVEIRFRKEYGLAPTTAGTIDPRLSVVTTVPETPTASDWSLVETPGGYGAKPSVALWSRFPATVSALNVYFLDVLDAVYTVTGSWSEPNGGAANWTLSIYADLQATFTVSATSFGHIAGYAHDGYVLDIVGGLDWLKDDGYGNPTQLSDAEASQAPEQSITLYTASPATTSGSVTCPLKSFCKFVHIGMMSTNRANGGVYNSTGWTEVVVIPTEVWTLLGTQAPGIGADLAAAIDVDDTPMLVENYSSAVLSQTTGITSADQVGGLMMALVGSEWLSCGAASVSSAGVASVPILRGQKSSTAAAHAAGVPVYFRLSELLATYKHTKFEVGKTFKFRVSALNAVGESTTSAPISITFSDRPSEASLIGYNGATSLTSASENVEAAVESVAGATATNTAAIATLEAEKSEMLNDSATGTQVSLINDAATGSLCVLQGSGETSVSRTGNVITVHSASTSSTGGSGARGLFSGALSDVPTIANTGLTEWYNQQDATIEELATGLRLSRLTTTAVGLNARQVPVPSSTFTCTVLVSLTGPIGNYAVLHFGLRNSISTKAVQWFMCTDGRFLVGRWTGLTNASVAVTNSFRWMIKWLRLRVTATNCYFEFSEDGISWALYASYTHAAWVVTPTHLFVACEANGLPVHAMIHSWSLTATTPAPTRASTGLTNTDGLGASTVADITDTGVSITNTTQGTSASNCIIYKPAPATSYKIDAKIQLTGTAVGATAFLGYRSTAGSHIEISICGDGTIRYQAWSSINTKVVESGGVSVSSKTVWLGLRDDGSNVWLVYSLDGSTWVTLLNQTQSSTAIMAMSYDQVCFGCGSASASAVATILSWTETILVA